MTGVEILQLGESGLREPALPVSDIHAADTRHSINLLTEHVLLNKGMGIAATQLGINQQIFIMCSHPNDRYPDAPEMPVTAVINPRILWQSDAMVKDWEGCLSVPGIRALVPRHQTIEVAYTQQDGTEIQIKYDGFLARLFQHEYDHLQGRVFIDRVSSTEDMMTEKVWQQQIASKRRQSSNLGTRHGPTF